MAADTHRANEPPIAYMERTRHWYLALGYGNPYRWAHHGDVPFHRLARPLARSTVALVTTAAPYQPGKGPQGPGAPYNAAVKFYRVYSGDSAADHDVRIAHVEIDRVHTSMEDSGTWFPLPFLREAARRGRIGTLARRFHGMPSNRSQRHVIEADVPQLLARLREDGADAAVLVPNCPVCHQTLCLAARHLEANGIATVVMGCALDIVEHCGVPRFVFSDFPLGNAAGRPHDRGSQEATLELALSTLESAVGPRTTVRNPLRWGESDAWKRDYMDVTRLTPEDIARLRTENDAAKAIAKGLREDLSSAAGR